MAIRLSKVFTFFLIIYLSYFQAVFFRITNMLQILGSLAILFLLIDMYQNKTPIKVAYTKEVLYWLAFALSSFMIGFFISTNKTHFVSSMFTFAQNLALLMLIIAISTKEKSIDFIVKTIMFLSVLSAFTTLFWGEGYHGTPRISLTADTNPNGFGILLVTGIFCFLYRLDMKKTSNIVATLLSIGVFTYLTILGGSRKAFIAALLLLIYWVLFALQTEVKKTAKYRRIVAVIIVSVGLVAVLLFLSSTFFQSLLFERLSNTYEHGFGARGNMYREAISFFLASPLFGIGYKQYEILSVYRTYSHSTYAEILACTGLFGAFLYFTPYFAVAIKTLKMIFNKQNDVEIRAKAREVMGMFIALLFMGVAAIHMYEVHSIIAFGMIFSFVKLNHNPQKKASA